MAWRRMLVHGSLEEMELFEPIYNTRLRLQHGASSSRFQLPDPPTSVDSELEGEDDGANMNCYILRRLIMKGVVMHEGAEETTPCWRSSDNITKETAWTLPDNFPRSTTGTDHQVGCAHNGNTGLQAPGDGSQLIPAAASPDSDSDTGDLDSDRSCERE